jgi:hypothetical protein
VADALDRHPTDAAVLPARPAVVVEPITALPRRDTPETMSAAQPATTLLRSVGGDNVYAAAMAAGAAEPTRSA